MDMNKTSYFNRFSFVGTRTSTMYNSTNYNKVHIESTKCRHSNVLKAQIFLW